MKLSTLLLCLLALSAFISVVWAGSYGGGEGEGDLEACLRGLSEDALTEATLELELDALKAEYNSIRPQVDVFQWYRDDNRTEALICLKKLTLCNDANEFKTVSLNGDKRQVLHRDVEPLEFKHPIEKHEEALRARIATLDRHFAQDEVRLAPKRHGREVLQCTLEQCIDFRASSIASINSLELAVEKYRGLVSRVKNSVITWSRYSRLYQEYHSNCLDALVNCTSGKRRLYIEFTNGWAPVGEEFPESRRVTVAWAGLGDSSFSFAGYGAALNALSSGDDVAVNDAFSGTNLNGITLTSMPPNRVGPARRLFLGQLVVDPTYHTHFSYIAGQVNRAYQMAMPGDSLVLFDEDGNFIQHLHPQAQTRSTRSKRYDWPNLNCSPEGHPISFGGVGERRRRSFLTDFWSEESGPVANTDGEYGFFTVEERRFDAPYPSFPDFPDPEESSASSATGLLLSLLRLW